MLGGTVGALVKFRAADTPKATISREKPYPENCLYNSHKGN